MPFVRVIAVFLLDEWMTATDSQLRIFEGACFATLQIYLRSSSIGFVLLSPTLEV